MIEKTYNKVSKYYDLKTDILSKENKINVYAEVPGMNIQDLDVRVIGKFLVIEGVKKKHYENSSKLNSLEDGCHYGYFKKYIAIPSSFMASNQNVNLENGILHISLSNRYS